MANKQRKVGRFMKYLNQGNHLLETTSFNNSEENKYKSSTVPEWGKKK